MTENGKNQASVLSFLFVSATLHSLWDPNSFPYQRLNPDKGSENPES